MLCGWAGINSTLLQMFSGEFKNLRNENQNIETTWPDAGACCPKYSLRCSSSRQSVRTAVVYTHQHLITFLLSVDSIKMAFTTSSSTQQMAVVSGASALRRTSFMGKAPIAHNLTPKRPATPFKFATQALFTRNKVCRCTCTLTCHSPPGCPFSVVRATLGSDASILVMW